MIFATDDEPTYETSDHSLIMHLLVCGVQPVRTQRDGRRVCVHFPMEQAIDVIKKTTQDADYMVKLTDVMRAGIIWKGILDGTR